VHAHIDGALVTIVPAARARGDARSSTLG
jgi:hypothetical protein